MGFCEDRVFSKKLVLDQLSCCLLDNIKYNCTTDNISDCYDLGDSLTNPNSKSGFLVQCHTIRDINACNLRGKTHPAQAICDKKDSLYCLAGGAPIITKETLPYLLPAYKWALNRTLYVDSFSEVRACYNESDKNFIWCGRSTDEPSTIKNSSITLECKDFFFTEELYDCVLKGGLVPSLNMTIPKNICKDPNLASEASPTNTLIAVTPISSSESNGLSASDKIALGAGIPGLLVAVTGVLFAYYFWNKRKNKPLTHGKTNQQPVELSNFGSFPPSMEPEGEQTAHEVYQNQNQARTT